MERGTRKQGTRSAEQGTRQKLATQAAGIARPTEAGFAFWLSLLFFSTQFKDAGLTPETSAIDFIYVIRGKAL